MHSVLAAELAVLLELKLVRRLLLVLVRVVILTLAVGAIQTHCNSHGTSLKKLCSHDRASERNLR